MLSTRGLKVYMYDLKGNYIRSFATLTEASNEMNINLSLLSRATRGLRDTGGGYRWSREMTDKLEEIELPVYEMDFHQYKITGEYMDSFANLDDYLDKTYGKTSSEMDKKELRNMQIGIGGCLKGKSKNYHGYQWSKEKVENIGKEMGYLSVYKRVIQKDKKGSVIAIHDSLTEAVRSLGLPDSCSLSLGHVVRGSAKTSTYKGFKWEYVDEKLF